MRLIACFIFGLSAAAPASAEYAALRPLGAAPPLDGCQIEAGYPDCHPDRILEGRSVVIIPAPQSRLWPPPAYYQGPQPRYRD